MQIPTDPVIKNLWIDRIRKSREDATWKPTKTTVVCSDHFRSKDMHTTDSMGRRRLKKEAVPSKKLFLSSVQSDGSEDSLDTLVIVEQSNSNEAEPSNENNDIEFVISNPLDNELNIKKEQVPNDPPEATTNNKTAEVQNNPEIAETNEAQNNAEIDEEFSDLDSVFDSPQEEKLRRKLRRKIALERKHVLQIKSLRQKNLRLMKKVASLQLIIERLKKERKQTQQLKE
uniref:THAP-type domain-containing protein n=1 Tax=Heliothis virescens TaxID=7102 RepID=A0A2A4K678_HELVI